MRILSWVNSWVVFREAFGLPKEGILGCPHRHSCFFTRGTHFVLQVFSMQMDRTGLPSHAASPMPGAREKEAPCPRGLQPGYDMQSVPNMSYTKTVPPRHQKQQHCERNIFPVTSFKIISICIAMNMPLAGTETQELMCCRFMVNKCFWSHNSC